jgi:hypothetical protein
MKNIYSVILRFVFVLACGSILQFAYGQPEIEWTKTYGGSGEDGGSEVIQTSDGGYIILGNKDSNDLWMIKTDAQGETQWSKIFGDAEDIEGSSIKQTPDGGYLIVGNKLLKTDSIGNKEWINDHISGTSIQHTLDGGYIILGPYSYETDMDLLLTNLDPNGDTIWTNALKIAGSGRGKSIQQSSDGGYIITGDIMPDQANEPDVWLIRTDPQGDTTWTKTYDVSGSEWGNSVQQTMDGGFIIASSMNWDHMCFAEGVLIKTDANGETQWIRTDTIFGYDALQVTGDGGYVILGYHYDDCSVRRLIRTDSDGNMEWTLELEGQGGFSSLQQTTDGGYILTGGISSDLNSNTDVLLIKVVEDPSSIPEKLIDNSFRIYPNPSDGLLTMETEQPGLKSIEITNFNGQQIFSGRFEGASHQIDISSFPKGVYFITIRSEDFVRTKKIIKL